MQERNHTEHQEHYFFDNISELQKVNKKLSKLLLLKEELTNNIINSLEHTHEGQKTYEHGVWKIEVRTPFVYSLNKKLYESGQIKLPSQYNPIKESLSYAIDKRLCDKLMSSAPKKVRESLIELIDKKPGKAQVIVKERV